MKEKKELLKSYIRENVAPMLIDFIEANNLPNAVILPATAENKEFNGHYEDEEFCPPNWLKELIENKEKIILVIDKIDEIPKKEQEKFIEILKYKQVSTFDLPQNCRIIITAKDFSKVSKEIKSLTAIF